MHAKIVLLTTAIALAATSLSAQRFPRSITQVAGDVYRFQDNFHYALVTVTGEGVVVVDPINEDASTWLVENLNEITDQEITHLIYSHSHLDHASGGTALDADTIIAQANAPADIDGVVPTERFEDTKTMTIGDKTFEMTYLGEGHGEDLIAVVVRPENVAFITDIASPKRLPFRNLPGSSPDGWLAQMKTAYALDFEIFAPAHAGVGVKEDLADAITYMELLRSEVLSGLKDGKSIEDLQVSLTLDAYKDWQGYDDWRTQNIAGMGSYLLTTNEVN